MKMMSMKTMALVCLGVASYMYLKKHPTNMENIKKIGRDTTRKVYNLFEEDY